MKNKFYKKFILFDLGNTLVQYYERNEFPEILKQAINEVHSFLNSKNLCKITTQEIWQRTKDENYEAKDYSVRPLEGRLSRIFRLDNPSEEIFMSVCRCFMKPIFNIAKIYEDTLPTLKILIEKDYKIGIISNTAWGSPAELWKEELRKFGIDKYIDVDVYCRDIGWRKPSERIFEFALKKLGAMPEQCLFIGDDPRWDIAGPKAVGIEAILIDRKNVYNNDDLEKILDLNELLALLVN
jgi:putative hydrolase of the HAD superfamily